MDQMEQAMAKVPDDSPLMIAWNAWRETEQYANVLAWAGKLQEGNLWAAFMAGYQADASDEHG
jgi:hypothetical protein